MLSKLISLITRCSDFVFPCLLIGIIWQAGSARLADWNGPAGSLTNDLFVPAIMMNAGRGFVNMEPSTVPALRKFLDFQTQEFDPTLITSETVTVPLHPYQEFHRYLIYSVALAWRIFGTDWDAIKILILVFSSITGLFLYGLCRLTMNSLAALLVSTAFTHAQAVLWTLPILRDYVKAPFIMALLVLLAIIIKHKLSFRSYTLLAVGCGLALGTGMGFRRDMMVFLPIVILLLLLCSLTTRTRPVLRRLCGVSLMIVIYLLSGLPIHMSLHKHGYVAAHDAIMGFASYSDHELGVITPASYEKHYLLNDLFCTLKAHDAAKRGITFPPEEYEIRSNDPDFDIKMKEAYVRAIFLNFPADMLTRAYAAVLRIITAVITSQHTLPKFIENYGLWFVAAGLVVTAAFDPWRASLILVLLCYFCGCTSMQFAIRHVFHLSFIPYFFAGMVLQHALSGIGTLGKSIYRKKLSVRPEKCLLRIKYACAWTLLVVMMFATPLWAARTMQRHAVSKLFDAYANSETVDIPFITREWNDRIIFIPTGGIPCHLCQTMGPIYNIQTRHLSASFKNVQEPLDLLMVYEWGDISWDFSAPGTFNLLETNIPVNCRYFFPVHDTTTCTDWNHFVGLSLPKRQADWFTGFARVKDIANLGLLINMIVPEDKARFIGFQGLKIPWYGSSWTNYTIYEGFNPHLAEMDIRNALANDKVDLAVDLAEKSLAKRPDSIQFTFLLAEALDASGMPEEAARKCLALLDTYPDAFVLYAQLDQFFNRRGGPDRRIKEWDAVFNNNPSLICAKEYLDQALIEKANSNK